MSKIGIERIIDSFEGAAKKCLGGSIGVPMNDAHHLAAVFVEIVFFEERARFKKSYR